MASPARMVGLGVFVVAGLLLFTVGLFMIGDRQMAFAKKFTIYTEFKKITGLQPGAVVRVSGAKAGTIRKILPPYRPSEKFRVELEITEELHPLVRTDSIASIETEGLVGGTFLGIGTGSDTAPAVPRDSTIPGREPFELADLMQQMAETVTKVNDTIDKVNDGIDDMKDDVQRGVSALADTADNANAIITAVSGDVKAMASAGARISRDASEITASIQAGTGTIGKLVKDDELYRHTTAIAKQVEDIATRAREVVEQAKTALEGFQSKDGPVQGVTANVKQTMDDARAAMAGFAENMEALKHNFLVRGFFNDRGYFNLAEISPAAYRQGALTRGGAKRSVRVWLSSAVLFDHDPDKPSAERLTDGGKARLDSAIADFLDRLPGAVVMVEGYAQDGTKDDQYLRARERAAIVRDYLIGRYHLDPQASGIMPLGSDSTGSPNRAPWDGVALAVFEEKPRPKKGK